MTECRNYTTSNKRRGWLGVVQWEGWRRKWLWTVARHIFYHSSSSSSSSSDDPSGGGGGGGGGGGSWVGFLVVSWVSFPDDNKKAPQPVETNDTLKEERTYRSYTKAQARQRLKKGKGQLKWRQLSILLQQSVWPMTAALSVQVCLLDCYFSILLIPCRIQYEWMNEWMGRNFIMCSEVQNSVVFKRKCLEMNVVFIAYI